MHAARDPAERALAGVRGGWIAAALAAVLVVALAGVAVGAARRDRDALLTEFGEGHLSRIRLAADEIEAELAGIRQDLAFAAHLAASTRSSLVEERALEALLAVARAYRLAAVYDRDLRPRVWVRDPRGPPVDAHPGGALAAALARTAGEALGSDHPVMSGPVADQELPWLRVLGTRVPGEDRALVVVVDLQTVFARLRVVAADPATHLLVYGPRRNLLPVSDPGVAGALARGPSPVVAGVLARMWAGETGVARIPEAEAAGLGLAGAEAVSAFTPIRFDVFGHWSVAVVSSTVAVRTQERAIQLRAAAVSAALVAVVAVLAAYAVRSSRRRIAMRERLRSAEEVARLHRTAETILDHVPGGVLGLAPDGTISRMNRAWRERVPPASRPAALEAALPRAPGAEVGAIRALVEAALRDGAARTLPGEPLALGEADARYLVHAVPLAEPAPDLAALLVLEDVTPLHQLSAQLLRAEKLATVGVLAAGIAHEIGTPLGVVRARAEILARRLGAEHPLVGSADVIVEEIDRVSRVIRELLDFSRVSPPAARAVDVGAAARDVAELLAFQAQARAVRLVVEAPGELPPIAADPDQLRQVLVNLVMNAIDACAPRGRVELRAALDPGGAAVRVAVSDDGAGIPEELRHRIFDPFFTTKKRGKGTGLGLTVAAHIVRNHAGAVDVESEVGRGTRVTVTWPTASAEEAEDVERERRARPDRR